MLMGYYITILLQSWLEGTTKHTELGCKNKKYNDILQNKMDAVHIIQ